MTLIMALGRESRRETICCAGILILFSVMASIPAWIPGWLVLGDDSAFHLVRIEGIKDGLLAGQFPVRLNPLWGDGCGMPTGIFYPDIFLYPFALLRICGIPLSIVWRLFAIAANVLTAFAAWWAFSTYTRSRRAGAVATLFYLAFLYRLINLYARAACGEVLAMAFLPGALVATWLVLRRDAGYWPAVVFFTTCVLQSHIITSLLLLMADAGMMLASWKSFRKSEVRRAAGNAALFTFLANLWFYAPLFWFHVHMDYQLRRWMYQAVMMVPPVALDYFMGRALVICLAGLVVLRLYRRCRHHETFPKDACILMLL